MYCVDIIAKSNNKHIAGGGINVEFHFSADDLPDIFCEIARIAKNYKIYSVNIEPAEINKEDFTKCF